jgi:uncharacterized protein YndB with AHSA1/START domain
MKVDVVVETVIARPVAQVAAFAGDPMNAPKWYVNIKSATWKSDPPSVELGSRIAFVAHFLGKRIEYTYEITELVPGEKLVMRTAEGPFPMETTYTWSPADAPDGKSTRMTLRNRGEPKGFATLMAPLMSSAMRKATQKDLAKLKSLLEREADAHS